MAEESTPGELVPRGQPFEAPDMSLLAQQLVASAAGQGIQLTGDGGLLTALTRQVLQTALEVEMAEHLGHERYSPGSRGAGNIRNGSSPKTVRTEIGEVTIDVPRDRAGTFEPKIVPKHQRRLAGFDEAVISLYAKGMTTGDIAAHLAEVYDTEISRDLVSRVTDAVVADMRIWAVPPAGPGLPGDPDRRDRCEDPGRRRGQPPGLRRDRASPSTGSATCSGCGSALPAAKEPSSG